MGRSARGRGPGRGRSAGAARWWGTPPTRNRPTEPIGIPSEDTAHRHSQRQVPSHSPLCEITTAITHLRDVLGDQTYESLARKGETMTTAEMVAHAYDQIDQARTELERPS